MSDEPKLGPRSEWMDISTAGGVVRVPSKSLIALALDPRNIERRRAAQIHNGRMGWSLGAFGDMLWMVVPEFRPFLVAQAKATLDEALEHDRFLGSILDTPLANHLYTDFLRPGLERLPDGQDLLKRCLAVLRRVLSDDDTTFYWDVFNIEILRPLVSDGWKTELETLDPGLMKMANRR